MSFEDISRKFTFDFTTDLDLSGTVSTDYIVSVTGTSGPVVAQSDTSTFSLTLKNPCIDPTYIIIQQVALPVDETYVLHAFKVAGGYKFTHDAFNIVTQPF